MKLSGSGSWWRSPSQSSPFTTVEANMSYRKIGGLRFIRIGRFGFSFWLSPGSSKQPKQRRTTNG